MPDQLWGRRFRCEILVGMSVDTSFCTRLICDEARNLSLGGGAYKFFFLLYILIIFILCIIVYNSNVSTIQYTS